MVAIKTLKGISQSVCLVKLKGIMRLWVNINSDNFKTCSGIAYRASTGTAK
jgi:hypothetical protein